MEFKECDTESIHGEGKNLNIIDTVKGIKDVELINNIDSITIEKIYTLHDFDLGYTLKLMKKMNMVDNVNIFAIPMELKEGKALMQLTKLIKSSLLSEND